METKLSSERKKEVEKVFVKFVNAMANAMASWKLAEKTLLMEKRLFPERNVDMDFIFTKISSKFVSLHLAQGVKFRMPYGTHLSFKCEIFSDHFRIEAMFVIPYPGKSDGLPARECFSCTVLDTKYRELRDGQDIVPDFKNIGKLHRRMKVFFAEIRKDFRSLHAAMQMFGTMKTYYGTDINLFRYIEYSVL